VMPRLKGRTRMLIHRYRRVQKKERTKNRRSHSSSF
jgi:hypothetical protein